MKMNYLGMFWVGVALVLFMGADARAAQMDVNTVSGEITWIDTKLGKLQLKSDASPGSEEVVEYRINQNDTRVTDQTDRKFLSIEDLQPGQHVTVDVIDGQEEMIVRKITANPRSVADVQEAYGHVEAIDPVAGKLVLIVRVRFEGVEKSELSYFDFEPATLVAMHSPSRTPVQLEVKPGDRVKVEYVLRNKKQWARSVTLYSPRGISTTTTTTVTTTQ